MPTSAEIDTVIDGHTVAKRFLTTSKAHPEAVVLRWVDSTGAEHTRTLTELAAEIARVAGGLKKLGVERGDRVVLMVRNRYEFHVIDLAVLFCGATPVSIYNSSAPEQIEYLVNHCGGKLAIVEDKGFYDDFAPVADKMPTLEGYVVIDPAGTEGLVSYAELDAAEPIDLVAAAETGEASDLATIIYTSGTTGPPKGVMLSNRNVCWTLKSISDAMLNQAGLDSFVGFRHVSYLPMAHIMERVLGHYYMVDFAIEVNCCPDTAQLAATVGRVHPNFFIGVPRVWEKLHAGIHAALAADPEKQQSFSEAVAAAEPIAERVFDGSATQEERETYEFLDAVAFTPAKTLLGLDQTSICISGAAPLRPDVLTWFRTIGVPLAEGYGMSETCAILAWSHKARAGWVGQAAPGIEIMLGEDGEVLARGGNMFEGYLNAPDKTAETMDADGWVHTGDIGELDSDGYLKIVDRKKELIITAGGKNVSPANLESALKGIPLVGQVCVVGDQRPFVSALLVLDADACAAYAAKEGLTGDDAALASLATNPDVLDIIEAGRVEVMSTFNNAEAVKKVTVLSDEWLPDTDVLTPTSKLKRRGILSRFSDEIEAMYA